jgi:integrase
MASIYRRGTYWWLKVGHPGGGKQLCFSLETEDPARARVLADLAQTRFDLMRPVYHELELPAKIRSFLGDSETNSEPNLNRPPEEPPPSLSSAPKEAAGQKRTPIRKVLASYTAYIRKENAPRHAANKLTHLRGFFGAGLLGEANGRVVFQGECLEDVEAEEIQRFVDGLGVGEKTRRHYRETFHHLFEFAMMRNLLLATNFRYPNPMAALPSYTPVNLVIRFLNEAEKENLYRVLAPHPSLNAAAHLMIEAGLRRAEALWLPRHALASDLSYMSIVNQTDPDSDEVGSLKTGSRPVTILPPLREFLRGYLPTLTGEWLVPSPTGKQWIGDNFGDAHRETLRARGLDFTCLHYRHTYATDRAREGWSLFRIAKEMGNSVAVVEKYYAAFVRPDA